MAIVDVLFLSWNRLAFTKVAFEALLANTDWSRVRNLRVFDDGSSDGTWEYLAGRCARLRIPGVLASASRTRRSSPVEVMRQYLLAKPADLFAKIDNDVVVPPGWLETMLAVLDANPAVELLGMEAGMTEVAGRDGKPWDGVYRVEPATNIGGVGVFRTAAFLDRPELRPDGRFGFTSWQIDNHVNRGWIAPDLPLVLLDRLPFEPWISRSHLYVDAGWQRPWSKYEERWMEWAWEGRLANDEAFWAKVDIGDDDECWPWKGGTFRGGYGCVSRNGRTIGAHRLAWLLCRGDLPDEFCVLHQCDNPPCCNPSHLFTGTHGDNARDKVSKGRHHVQVDHALVAGEKNPRARVTEAQVADIRRRYADGESQGEIAKAFGVARSTVGYIVRGEHWK